MLQVNRAGAANTNHQHWALAFLILTVFAVGLITLPAQQYKSDPVIWQEEARNIILHHRLSLEPREISPLSNAFGIPMVYNSSDGKLYSRYGLLNSLLSIPPLWAEKLITGKLPPLESPARVLFLGEFSVLLSLAIAAVLFIITGYYTNNLIARITFVLLAFYTTYLWNYLRCPMSESAQLLLFALCYVCFLRFERLAQPVETRSRTAIYLGWLSLLLLCQTRVTYLLFLPLFALALIRFVIKNGLPRKQWPNFIGWSVVLPLMIIILIQAVVQEIKFGNPFLTGYSQTAELPVPHTMLSATIDFLWGGQGSVFLHFPLLFLAIFGARRFVRNYSYDSLLLLGSLLITYLLVAPSSGPWRGEWAYGPRYFVFLLPLLALPALYALEWIFTFSFSPVRFGGLLACVMGGAFFITAQMQINRLDYFFKYRIEVGHTPDVPQAIQNYFSQTNFAKINWDHLECHGHWEQLPYYAEMQKHATRTGSMDQWRNFVQWEVSRSNLYWFPDNTRW